MRGAAVPPELRGPEGGDTTAAGMRSSADGASHARTRLWVLARAIGRLVSSSPAAPESAGSTISTADFSVFDVAKTPPDAEWEAGWRVTEALVRAMRTEVEQHGARFAVAVMPIRESIDPAAWQVMTGMFPSLRAGTYDLEYPVRRITEFLEHEGIPHLSLLPALRSAAEHDGHSGFLDGTCTSKSGVTSS